MPDDNNLTVHTKHGDLTLEQIAALQPGLATLMRDVSDRFWIAYYAAQAGNWPLTAHQLRATRKRFTDGALTRPQHKAMLDTYTAQILNPLLQQCESRDFAAFEKIYRDGIALANRMHAATKHGEIVWKLPPAPPQHLELGPVK
jgi:hypothetical protein